MIFGIRFQIIQFMSNYNRILTEFSRINLTQTSKLNEYQINEAMDKICQSNCGWSEFDREIAQQLFDHTQKDADNKLTVRNYINKILEAQKILLDNIKKCQDQLEYAHQEEAMSIKQNFVQFNDDYRILTEPFHIKGPVQSQKLDKSRRQVELSRRAGNSINNSAIFADSPSNRQESLSLKLVLVVTTICFIFEMILMFQRDHFLNLLAYTSILCIFFLNYFDQIYIKVCLGLLVVATLLDIVWIFTEVEAFWRSNVPPTQHSTLQTSFLRFIYVFTIILLFVKVILFILLFRYRNNAEDTKKTVKISNLKFDLDGRVTSNPLTLFILGRQNI